MYAGATRSANVTNPAVARYRKQGTRTPTERGREGPGLLVFR